MSSDPSEGQEGFTLLVRNLVRDGATSWIADLKLPEFRVQWDGVYLHGATEEEALQDAQNRARQWYKHTRVMPPTN